LKLGRDPGTGKARVLTGTAKSERESHRLLHELIASRRFRKLRVDHGLDNVSL